MGTEGEPFSTVRTCELHGQLAVILCWSLDGQDESDTPFAELRTMCKYLTLIPDLLTGNTEDFSDGEWWTFFDALGSYPERDDTLDELYRICSDGNHGKLPAGPTKSFCTDEGDRIADPRGNGHGS